MKLLMMNVKRYVSIYCIFIKNCLIAQMEYRANFVIGFCVESVFLFLKALYAVVIYRMDITINGITPDAMLLFIGTYVFMTGILNVFFFPNFIKISEYVRNGTLDMFITKPISLQFMVTLRYLDPEIAVPNLVGGIIMITMAWKKLAIACNFNNIAGYVLLLIVSTFVTYSIILISSLLAFWVVKTQSITDVTYALWDFNNMPMGIYNKIIKRVGVYIIPILVVSNFPTLYLYKANEYYKYPVGNMSASSITDCSKTFLEFGHAELYQRQQLRSSRLAF